jgi:glucose/arabinose dehydrogenase
MREKLFSILFFLALFFPGCGSPPPGRSEGAIGAARGENGQTVQFRVETVAANLEVPWAIAFAPDGRVFVTERPERVRVIEQGRLRLDPVATIREVESAEESGLMDLTLHPQFASNHYLFSTSNRNGRGNPAANDDRILRLVPLKGGNE